MIVNAIKKLPNYIRAFGAFHGVRLLVQTQMARVDGQRAPGPLRVPGFTGDIFLRSSTSDRAIFWQCIVQRQYELGGFAHRKRLMSAYSEFLRKGIRPLIIDCGGNIGLSTICLSSAFPEALIYVVEPDRHNLELLQRNVKPLGERVVALHGGIWSESGRLGIINPTAGSASFQVGKVADDVPDSVRAYTIEEICNLAGADSPFVVKIDIEGGQADLFRSSTSWVGSTHLIIIELEDWLLPWRGTSRPFLSCISQYPFEYLISGENLFCFRDFAENELGSQ